MTKRLRVGGAILLAGAIACVGLLALRQWANRPADGSLHTKAPIITDDLNNFDASAEAVSVQNEYFTVGLPAGFKVKRQTDTPKDPTLLQLVANDKHRQLAITVATLPPEGLVGVGSYNLRVKNTAAYEPLVLEGMPPAAVAFQATEGPPAFVVFWPHGERYAEIALTSDGGATFNELSDSFLQTIQTWQWR